MLALRTATAERYLADPRAAVREEHYVVDILTGWAVAGIVALVVEGLEARAKLAGRERLEAAV